MSGKTTWDLNQDGRALAAILDEIEGMDEGDDQATLMGTLTERLGDYGEEVGHKFLALDFAERCLTANADGYRQQMEAFKRAVKRTKAGVERVKALKVSLLQAHGQATGKVNKKGVLVVPQLTLPDGSKAWLVQRETTPKAAWDKRQMHLLPEGTLRTVESLEVDKDALLEHLHTHGNLLDAKGEPLATVEWVDPTHTRRK